MEALDTPGRHVRSLLELDLTLGRHTQAREGREPKDRAGGGSSRREPHGHGAPAGTPAPC